MFFFGNQRKKLKISEIIQTDICFRKKILFPRKYSNLLNPLTTNVPYHIETSQLICNANQLTGFYKMGNIWSLKG